MRGVNVRRDGGCSCTHFGSTDDASILARISFVAQMRAHHVISESDSRSGRSREREIEMARSDTTFRARTIGFPERKCPREPCAPETAAQRHSGKVTAEMQAIVQLSDVIRAAHVSSDRDSYVTFEARAP
jgi:hypothetical protein